MPGTFLKWPGLSESNTLIISVDKTEFGLSSAPLEHDGKVFKAKPETHITVFGSITATAVQQQARQSAVLAYDLISAFENTDWSFTVTDDYRHLLRTLAGRPPSEETEESIIVMLEMQGMTLFYEKLKHLHLIDRDHPVPPPHVTLYTYNCDVGIGVPSSTALAKLTHARLSEL